ncbi:MAG: heavy metal translocating P-type ATPase [Bacteroidetes bacterium]|nr:heavy metal translocating P-type ATPase [Bacteroidota bacterium]
MAFSTETKTTLHCFHCGAECVNTKIIVVDKNFCCEGCKMVFEILNQTGMCGYYDLNQSPGSSQKFNVRTDKFSFLEDTAIEQSIISFKDENQTHVTFYLPQIHCSSCLWLLENLHKIEPGVVLSHVNFERKEAAIVYNHKQCSLRKVAELLTRIGYEPYISYSDMGKKRPRVNSSKIYRLGVAGFCFANIMLLSFPEYLGIDQKEENLLIFFRYVNVLLSLPVFFYSAGEFYNSAWQGIKQKFLNIDAPIVLAIWVTFIRSLFEIFSGTGSGYLDSMSGIVFFMLAGRILQDRTQKQLSFERDYTSYFPVAVTKVNGVESTTLALPDIQLGDTLRIHDQELIPADGILTRGNALIDYSFVTGESLPVVKEMGEIIYAGGKQLGGNIELLVIKEVAQGYLTSLWNKDAFKEDPSKDRSFVHNISYWFTWGVLLTSFAAGIYWYFTNVIVMWNAVTAVLIVACPCALLLSNTFTNGSILRIFSNNKFYLRNATVIEKLATANTLVFDKTGTLTTRAYQDVVYQGLPITSSIKMKIGALAAQSSHPLSNAIANWSGTVVGNPVIAFEQIPGSGIEGMVDDDLITLGSSLFVTGKEDKMTTSGSVVHVAVEGVYMGFFRLQNQYRKSIPSMLQRLTNKFTLLVISGDNDTERSYLRQLLGPNTDLYFNQQPADKLTIIEALQKKGSKTIMLGDGLNDAGALKQSHVGIAITDDTNNFTPASDAILDASKLPQLEQFIQLAKANKVIVMTAFVISIVYNIIGLSFAVQGLLSPMIAAILMPISSISILLISFGFTHLTAKWLSL